MPIIWPAPEEVPIQVDPEWMHCCLDALFLDAPGRAILTRIHTVHTAFARRGKDFYNCAELPLETAVRPRNNVRKPAFTLPFFLYNSQFQMRSCRVLPGWGNTSLLISYSIRIVVGDARQRHRVIPLRGSPRAAHVICANCVLLTAITAMTAYSDVYIIRLSSFDTVHDNG